MSYSQNLITNIFTGKLSSLISKPEEYAGDLVPDTNDVYNLGSSTKRWNNLYVDTIVGNLSVINIPKLITGNILYINPSTGAITYGQITGGGNTGPIPDPLTIGTINSTDLNTVNLSVSGNVISDLNLGGQNINNVNNGIFQNLQCGTIALDVIDNRTNPNISFLTSCDFNTVFNISRVGTLGATTINASSTINTINMNSTLINTTNIISSGSGNFNNISSGNITNSGVINFNRMSGGNIICNNITSNEVVNSNIINANSCNIVGLLQSGNIINSGNITSSIVSASAIGANSGKIDNLLQCGNIISFGNIDCQILNYTTLNPPISGGTLSKLFFNRLTAIALSGTANTRNQLSFLTGTAGTDYIDIVNSGFTLNTGLNAITYSGLATKNFYVQCSFALQPSATATNIGIELVKNTTPISQGRWNTASSLNLDLQDFNCVSLSNGDSLSLFYSCSNVGSTLASNSQTGMTGSTTKPVQIWITEI